jgi:protein-S-isoprenylcysteine O-methyltransferase Ste14
VLIAISRWVIVAASLSLLLVYFQGGSLIVKDTKRSVETTGGYIYIVFTVMMCLAGLTILSTQFLICLRIVNAIALAENSWIVTLGALLVVIGIAAAFWIRHRYLRGFWSGTVEIRENHQVVKEGPYRIVRHPIYALTLLIYPGVALAFAVWWNWIACGVMIVGYLWLTAYEDKYLEGNLVGYQEYQQLTRYRLIPGIW